MSRFKEIFPHLVSCKSLSFASEITLSPCNFKKFQNVQNPMCVGLIILCGSAGNRIA